MFSMGAEERLILLLSRVQLPGDMQADLASFWEEVRGRLDYRKVIELASLNLVSPLLYRNFLKLQDVPAGILAETGEMYYYTLRKNVLHSQETVRLIGLLQSGGVEVVPLKGSLASDIIFRDPGLYPTGDIDLLVRPEDLKRTEKILLDAGYRKDSRVSERDLFSQHYHLIFHSDAYIAEVHWNLVKRYFTVPAEFWWEEKTRMEYGEAEILQLSVEKYLMYLIFHLFLHGYRPLKFFVLISELINVRREEIDWGKFFSYADEYKMRRLVLFTLDLLGELLGTRMPGSLGRRKIAGHDFLKGLVLSGLFRDAARVHLRMSFYALLLDSPLEVVRVVMGRIFPAPGELRLRFGLEENSKKVYLYYLLNPFFLILRRR
jgi:hypothetical protein